VTTKLPVEHGEIEVCERIMSRRPNGRPRYHAQLKGRQGVYGAGDTPSDAIGDLVFSHPKQFGVVVTLLPGRHPR
jgi:hypothetical protein